MGNTMALDPFLPLEHMLTSAVQRRTAEEGGRAFPAGGRLARPGAAAALEELEQDGARVIVGHGQDKKRLEPILLK